MSKKKNETPAAQPAELVQVPGVTADIWTDAASTFVPVLKKDFTPAQRQDAVRQVLQQSASIDDRINLVQGELLYEVNKNDYWKTWDFIDKDGAERKYKNFLEYAQVECGLEKRKAYYLVEIYELYVLELGLSIEVLRNLEWSKAKVLKGVITKENAEEMLKRLKSMSKRELEAYVRDLKATGQAGDGGESVPEFVPIKLRLTADQASNLKDALSVAKSMTRNPDGSEAADGSCVDFIVTDFLAGQAGPGLEGVLNRLDMITKHIERTFGVTLKVENFDEKRYQELKEQTPTA